MNLSSIFAAKRQWFDAQNKPLPGPDGAAYSTIGGLRIDQLAPGQKRGPVTPPKPAKPAKASK